MCAGDAVIDSAFQRHSRSRPQAWTPGPPALVGNAVALAQPSCTIMDTNRTEDLTSWLTQFLADAHGVAGTVHLHENGGLRLGAAVNIPEPVRRVVEWVPSGKGMAGLALERGEPVQTCNLKEDRSGAVKPGAAAVDAKAAVAMPVRDGDGSIIAVVGIAFPDDREIAPEELERLTRAADSLVAAPRERARD